MRDAAYERLERATAELEAPFAIVDLDAFWDNANDLVARAGGKPIRLASKSMRCRALQERVLAREGFRGTLAFTLPEALWLAENGFDDIVVAYPTADEAALGALARAGAVGTGDGEPRVAVMVDCVEHLEMIERAGADGRVRVCIDVDASWRTHRRGRVQGPAAPAYGRPRQAVRARPHLRHLAAEGRLHNCARRLVTGADGGRWLSRQRDLCFPLGELEPQEMAPEPDRS